MYKPAQPEAFEPQKNDCFIVECVPTANGVQDRSWSTDVFRCIEADEKVVVGVILNRSPLKEPIILRRNLYRMFHVSQAVVDAVKVPARDPIPS